MIELFEDRSRFTAKVPCPTGKHGIELNCEPQALLVVPRECPECGIGLPDAYRAKLREILNVTRFQMQQLDRVRTDIEILSA